MSQLITVPNDASGVRVDVYLASVMRDSSRAEIQRWIREERVLIDGQPCRAKDRLLPGSSLRVTPGPAPPSLAEPDASVSFEIVHEDAHLIVVNKPAGLVVHPGKGNFTGTLVNGLLALPSFGRPPADPRDPEGPLRPGVVHRIDKDTSGLLVIAKDAPTREGLKTQFAEHTIERAYVAITVGVPNATRIESTHARHPTQRLKFTSLGAEGKRAVTHVVLEEAYAGLAARVRCRLETGRTHQIRVHLAEQLSTPLLADALYGRSVRDPLLKRAEAAVGRQALHAGVLGFVHPISQEQLVFESPLPGDMCRALSILQQAEASA